MPEKDHQLGATEPGEPSPLPVREIAPHVWRIGPWGRTLTVVYLIRSRPGWTLVDAGWVGDGDRIAAAVAGVSGPENPVGILLTHAHPDHEGDCLGLSRRWNCPVWLSPDEYRIACRDFDAMLTTAMPLDRWVILPIMRLLGRRKREELFARTSLAGVARSFDPDSGVPGLPDWECIPSPGHTSGHISLFRASDRVLVSGDALVTVKIDTITNLLLRRSGLSRPPWYTTWNRDQATASIAKLATLEPTVIAGGHGMPLTELDTTAQLRSFADDQ